MSEHGSTAGRRPAEGYHPQAGRFLKAFSIGAPDLAGMPLEQIAAHPLTQGMDRHATQTAVGAGYRPTGLGALVHAEPDGTTKTLLIYAVPVEAPSANPAGRDYDDD